jgi:hypothetical protein
MLAAMPLDDDFGEVIGEHEAEATQQIAALIRTQVTAAGLPARRDAHPKAHGCVRAEFRVRDDLPAELAHGVFVPGKTYAAWIRFSNASGDVTRSDAKGDARGMAVKLLGVPGDKLLPDERTATTHDFVMINSPVFIVDDPARYLTFLERSSSKHWWDQLLIPFALGLRGVANAFEISQSKISNPLEARYWSTTAYRLGPHAVKYSAVPRAPLNLPAGRGDGFLRDAMVATLAARDVELDFLVQRSTSQGQSVERTTVEWPEVVAPFERVATITIPRQEFATPERDAFGENLSYTPWHALPEHRPLGAVNRVRRVVYEAISKLRHEKNGAVRAEPEE